MTNLCIFIHFARTIVKNLTKSALKNNDKPQKIAGNNWKIEFLYKYSRKKFEKCLTYCKKYGKIVLWKSAVFVARVVSYN